MATKLEPGKVPVTGITVARGRCSVCGDDGAYITYQYPDREIKFCKDCGSVWDEERAKYDEHGQVCPTRPCPKCGRVIPIKRVHPASAQVHQWRAWSVATWVEWCGHRQEVVLVPEGDGWYAEIPVLGVAR